MLNDFDNQETFEIIAKLQLESGLEIVNLFDLNWGAVYRVGEDEFKQMNFIAFALSHKSFMEDCSKYEWLDIEEFVSRLNWDDSKELLKRVLMKGIESEAYFDKKERGQ